eukprot:190859_1
MRSEVEACVRTEPSLPETERCKVIREMFLNAENTLDTHEALMKEKSDSNKLNQRGKKVKVRTIDCMKDRALCRRFRINGYPSIAFFDVIERWPLALVSI